VTDILFYIAVVFLFAASLNYAACIASLAWCHRRDDHDWDDPA